MILAVDVGNTETVLGLCDGPEEPVALWRLATARERTADEIALTLEALLRRAPAEAAAPERIMIGSVVPTLNAAWRGAAERLGLPAAFLDGTAPLPIRLEVDHPREVGADRIANTLAAARLFARDAVIVDLGTATTFDCVSAEGVFLGGAIAPGPRTALDHLARSTAQLPLVEIVAPARVIGRNTLDCLRSGGFHAVVDGIDGMVSRILEEWGPRDPVVIATGGLAAVIGPQCRTVERIEPALTIRGLAIADSYLTGEVTFSRSSAPSDRPPAPD